MSTVKNAFYMNQYDELSNFETVEKMDEAIAVAKSYHADELNVTAMNVLDFIAQHAVKVVGVAKLLVPTIAEGVGKSLRTVNYATKKLVDLGIIEKHDTMRRKQGGSGANVYVIAERIADGIAERIADCPPSEIPCESKDEQPEIETETLFKTLSQSPIKSLKEFEKNNNTSLVKDQEIEYVQLFADTPQVLRKAYAGLDSILGNKLTKDIVLAFKKSGLSQKTEWTLQELCLQNDQFATELGDRIRDGIIKHRNGNVHTTLGGYIYTTALKMFEDRLAMIEAPTAETSEQLDLFGDLASLLKNVKIINPTHETSCAYINNDVETDFNNDDLPW